MFQEYKIQFTAPGAWNKPGAEYNDTDTTVTTETFVLCRTMNSVVGVQRKVSKPFREALTEATTDAQTWRVPGRPVHTLTHFACERSDWRLSWQQEKLWKINFTFPLGAVGRPTRQVSANNWEWAWTCQECWEVAQASCKLEKEAGEPSPRFIVSVNSDVTMVVKSNGFSKGNPW